MFAGVPAFQFAAPDPFSTPHYNVGPLFTLSPGLQFPHIMDIPLGIGNEDMGAS